MSSVIALMSAVLVVGADPTDAPIDWPSLIRKPHENLKPKDQGLKPLAADRAGWEAARAQIRESWLQRLGKSPEIPATLDVRIEKTETADGYTRSVLSLRAEGDDRLRAYLLVPDGLKPGEKRPAVVVFHPTTRDTMREPVGLGQRQHMALAVHLTRRGYVTLSPECFIIKDPVGWAKGQAEALNRRRPEWTGMGKMTFDAGRCVDLLASRPEVDADRIGCIGHSLGAKEVLYAMAFDPRYKVGVFSEGGIGLRMSNWFDAWYLTDRMKPFVPALEHHQLLALTAPRPFLIIGGGSADGPDSWAFVKAALPVYAALGADAELGLLLHEKGHFFPRDARRLAYRWLDRGLKFTPLREEVGTDP